MIETPDQLTPERLHKDLAGHPFVTQVVYQLSVGSTNDLAKTLASEGAAEGLLVIAEEQSAGRGRLGRQWWAPAGSALLTSLLFRPTTIPDETTRSRNRKAEAPDTHIVQKLMMMCALAAADAVTEITTLPVDLKWPNDLIVHGRKLAGLLAEAIYDGDCVNTVIVGLGMNVNTDFANAPNLMAPATSLRLELGRPVDRLVLLKAYLDGVNRRYAQLRQGDGPFSEWSSRLITLGQHVTARLGDQTPASTDLRLDVSPGNLLGIAEGVDLDGALLVRTADGTLHRLLAADVSLQAQALSPSSGDADTGEGGRAVRPSI